MSAVAVRSAPEPAPIWREARLEARVCGLCGADDYFPAGRRADGLRLCECRRCGLAYLNPVPDAASIRRLYLGDYFGSQPQNGTFRAYENYLAAHAHDDDPRRLEFRLLLEQIDDPARARVLEVGCAAGDLLSLFARRGSACAGVELNPEMAAFARRRLAAPIYETPLEDGLPIASGGFDVVIANSVLEHVERPGRFLDEVARLLAPGGLFYVTTPNWGCSARAGEDWIGYFGQWEHLCYFSDCTLRRSLSQRGFDVVVEGSGGPPARARVERRRKPVKRARRLIQRVPLLGRTAVALKRMLHKPKLRPLNYDAADYVAVFRKQQSEALRNAA